jgi:hypothetical protein
MSEWLMIDCQLHLKTPCPTARKSYFVNRKSFGSGFNLSIRLSGICCSQTQEASPRAGGCGVFQYKPIKEQEPQYVP